ncbi:hypothetical protein BSF38_04772 [Paludisphaera borealis]|uniref:Uncharacterized protein n=1 Tax=Paludisphaera borealis TaxID=1387353 RepID=A0A1U7CWD7_9BACT|nr:hypothetical protein BSF38_04772 [Paludisphaera borealis]
MNLSCRHWADAIGRATFSDLHAHRVVYLAIDKEAIGRIGREFDLEPEASYESFRAAVISEVQYGWPDPSLRLRQGQFPRYLTVLAAQVVSAFQMHDDELAGAKAYWRRLREFLGQTSEDKMPEGLVGWRHTALWKGLRQWANEVNGERLGRVRLVEQVRGHHLVAEPLSQCLLRRADLEKFRQLFAERGRPDREPFLGDRLRNLVDEARRLPSGRYFTKHSERILDDPRRNKEAWEQIEAEFKRFLTEPCPEAAARLDSRAAGGRRCRSGTAVLLQLNRRGLSGGLYGLADGRRTPLVADLGEVLRRCYLRAGREGSSPPHKPPHDKHLLAVRGDESGPFTERDGCRAGDEVLLLVPELFGNAWLDDADPRLFAEAPRRYQPSLRANRIGWVPLDGLPLGWLALRFKTHEDLTEATLEGKWVGVVDRRATGLRASGGLILRRGVWMLGAGPTVQVVGPGSYDHILVNGEPRPLDAARCATPDLGVGEYRIRLPGPESTVLRIQIHEPRRTAPGESAGWHRVECGWPASDSERRQIEVVPGTETLHGARLVGDWPPQRELEPETAAPAPQIPREMISEELAAMLLAVRLRTSKRVGRSLPRNASVMVTAADLRANPLLLGMLHANCPGFLVGTDKT